MARIFSNVMIMIVVDMVLPFMYYFQMAVRWQYFYMDIDSLQNWYIDSNSIQTHWRDPEYIFNWHWFWVSCRQRYSWIDTVQGHTCHRLRGSNCQIVVATFHYWLRINEIHVYGRGIKETSCHHEIKKTLTTGVFYVRCRTHVIIA